MTITSDTSLSAISSSQLRRLLEISTMLSSTLNLQELLQLVIQTAAELTNMEGASLLLMDEQAETLYFVATSNDPSLVGLTVPLYGSIVGWTARHAKPLVVQNVEDDERHYAGIDQFTGISTSSLLAVPLIRKARVIGVLEAINKQDDTPCTQQDIDLLQALASQAAVAIENARLFEQSDMVAEVMHELKTPLLALNAAIELLARPRLPADKRTHILTTLQRESKRLTKLVKDFLDLSRLDSGRFKLAWEPVDLWQLTDEVAAIQQPQAAQRHIDIRVVRDVDPIPCPNGDADRLKQVLLNLVSNAIKYNVEGGEIIIRLHQQNEQEIIMSVEDTGSGIAPANLEKLFDRFYRVPGDEGFTEGTGLGLSIAKRIMEAHDGRLEVKSELGKGTIFHCILKLET